MKPPTHARAYLVVVGAAALWGTLGVSYDLLLRGGEVDPITLVTMRLCSAALLLLGYVALWDRTALSLPRDARSVIAGIGVISFAAFYLSLVYAFRWSSVPVATVLLYTAPVWVATGEIAFLGYRPSRASFVAVSGAVIGSALVADLIQGTGAQAEPRGIAAGLLAAMAYASYSVLGKLALRFVRPVTVVTYGVTIGAACLVLVKLLVTGFTMPGPGLTVAIVLWPGIMVTVVPVALYTAALHTLRPSTASIIATLEPVVAIALSAAILGQHLSPWQLGGAVLVIAGAVYLALRPPVATEQSERPRAGRPAGG